jgi:hypothetical protein
VYTTPTDTGGTVRALADMTDNELLVEVMESDDAVSEDGSDTAADRQRAAAAEGDRRWGPDALERSAQWAVTYKASGADLIRIARDTPDIMFAIMRGER